MLDEVALRQFFSEYLATTLNNIPQMALNYYQERYVILVAVSLKKQRYSNLICSISLH
jgi:hypothetical protein